MKFVILALVASFSLSAFAALDNSQLEARHQALIVDAIKAKCGPYRGMFTEISTVAKETCIDQGICDVAFETVVEFTHRIDQGQFDYFRTTVKSELHDMYDHATGNWGAYSITSVSSCDLL